MGEKHITYGCRNNLNTWNQRPDATASTISETVTLMISPGCHCSGGFGGHFRNQAQRDRTMLFCSVAGGAGGAGKAIWGLGCAFGKKQSSKWITCTMIQVLEVSSHILGHAGRFSPCWWGSWQETCKWKWLSKFQSFQGQTSECPQKQIDRKSSEVSRISPSLAVSPDLTLFFSFYENHGLHSPSNKQFRCLRSHRTERRVSRVPRVCVTPEVTRGPWEVPGRSLV